MLTMEIRSLAYHLVQQVLIEERGNDKALHLHFDLGLCSYQNSKTYSQRRGLHLLYHLPPGYGSVSVFSAVVEMPFTKVGQVESWKHEITHDSCWRDINVFSDTYFHMAYSINVDRGADGLPEVAPITMHECNGFPFFGKMWDWVDVVVSKDLTDDSNYRRIIQLKGV